MVTLFDEDQLGPGDLVGRVGCMLEGNDCVVGAVGDERWCGDVGEGERRETGLVAFVVGRAGLASGLETRDRAR